MNAVARTNDDLLDLATALIREADRRGSVLRLLGGVAIYVKAPHGRDVPTLRRACQDLDFAALKSGSRVLPSVFRDLGWIPDARFNALHGGTRLMFTISEGPQADVFLGVFEQSHRLVFDRRIADAQVTLPIDQLLLTKLQIHQLNTKDVQDVLALMYDHDFGLATTYERPALDAILRLLEEDWGWYTTVVDNLITIREHASQLLPADDLHVITGRLDWLREQIEQAPKSAKWLLRSLIGRRWQWYEEPEEVHR